MSSEDDAAHRLQAIADAFYGGQATHAQSQSAVIDVVLDRLPQDRQQAGAADGPRERPLPLGHSLPPLRETSPPRPVRDP